MNPEDIAKAIASGDPIDWRRIGSEIAEIRLSKYWAEISSLVDIQAWRSVVAYCGQIVEGLIKHLLITRGFGEVEIGQKTLGQLMIFGRKKGVIANEVSGLTEAALSATLILRNWSSHYSLSNRDPDAVEAAQALALTIAVLEVLFPLDSVQEIEPGFGDRETLWQPLNSIPRERVRELRRLPPQEAFLALKSQVPSITENLVCYGAPSTLVSFATLLSKRSWPTGEFRDLLQTHFARVIRNATRSSFRKVMDLLLVLRRLGLSNHANILGVILPADPIFLAGLIRKRPAAYVALYLAECSKANRWILSSRVGDAEDRRVFINEFWRSFGEGSGNILNAANILSKIPLQVRGELLRQAPEKNLIKLIEDSDPLDSSNLLYALDKLMASADERLMRLFERVVSAIAFSVTTANEESIAALPLRLQRVKAVDPARSRPILAAALGRVLRFQSTLAALRVVWDVFNFFPELASTVIEISLELIKRPRTEMPVWEKTCILGLLAVASIPVPQEILDMEREDLLAQMLGLPPSVDRWQRFLFLVGAVDLARTYNSTKIPSDVAGDIERIWLETTNVKFAASVRLMELTGQAIGHLRKFGAQE